MKSRLCSLAHSSYINSYLSLHNHLNLIFHTFLVACIIITIFRLIFHYSQNVSCLSPHFPHQPTREVFFRQTTCQSISSHSPNLLPSSPNVSHSTYSFTSPRISPRELLTTPRYPMNMFRLIEYLRVLA